MLRKYLREVRNKLLSIVELMDFFWPKRDNYILCCSNGMKNINGNSLVLFDYLSKKKSLNIRYFSNEKNIKNGYINLKSLEGLLFFLRCKYLIGTHGFNDFYYPFSRKKTYIQSWHGIPLKSMGYEDKNEKSAKLTKSQKFERVDYFLSSSEFVSTLFERCFLIDKDKFIYSGYPRNDCLLGKKTKSLNLKYKHDVDRVILYAPTFRDWKTKGSYPFSDDELMILDDKLKENNTIMFFRLHPNDFNEGFNKKYNNIHEFSISEFPEINAYLNEFDLLITDYSSIYFDFLLTGNDCVLFPYDLDEYITNRGILFEKYEDVMVDRTSSNFNELIDNVFHINRNDQQQAKVDYVIDLLFRHQTDDSCSKILRIICEE